MEKHWPLAVLLAAMAALALIGFAYYRWRRHRGIGVWVDAYLRDRCGSPDRVSVRCSDDAHWPVLVDFDDPQSGMRHRLQFLSTGPPSMRLKS
jgi:hypothetical protein